LFGPSLQHFSGGIQAGLPIVQSPLVTYQTSVIATDKSIPAIYIPRTTVVTEVIFSTGGVSCNPAVRILMAFTF